MRYDFKTDTDKSRKPKKSSLRKEGNVYIYLSKKSIILI